MSIRLKLATDYKTIGNSNGEQISTLAIAVNGSDFNDAYLSFDFLDSEDESVNYIIDHYNYVDDFIKTLNKKERRLLTDDLLAFNEKLNDYKEARLV